ncbi:Beta-glucosidase, lactase phlorizinhydrolase [Handroanthus impetiginosus]|uniref:Beta-glucosidase, lactase phlorizinhydrolase n=1 Tax=Handroanthus impetiginosus TaxID=429701 RepID=A0A2G9H9B8_9LAMI|nr:Beta-glucosidase, lactase phlorizinhydrolase [Handroanthus impetiginosus]
MGTNAKSMASTSIIDGLEKKRKIEDEWRSIYSAKQTLNRQDFPPHFTFGVATAAFQVEGASREDGRGLSIWDAFTRVPGKICDGSNADITVDQYHRYKEDIELIAKLGFKAYRFSISWSRIFPDGLGTKINPEGIRHYNNVINALIDKDIQPYVTLYHWDLPLNLFESMGGWVNEEIVKYFAVYAETCFSSFGDRVKNWLTINEPLQTAVNGYCTGVYAPGRLEHFSGEPYLVAHHQLLAHAEAVSIYNKKYKDKQGGQIGLVVDCEWSEALSDRVEDRNAAARRLDFQLGWYLDPIYYGDYPKSMQEKLGDFLPKFSERDKELLKNSVDFIGLNHYTTRFVRHAADNPEHNDFYRVQEAERIAEWEGGETIGEKAASSWLYMVPWGVRKLLNYISLRYNNPPIYITENGMDDEDDGMSSLDEMLDDKLRVSYYKGYLAAVHQAIRDGADVRGYFAWSLLDNFEWQLGYTKRFGIIYVDYKNGLERHPKSSAYWFLRFLKAEEDKNDKLDY